MSSSPDNNNIVERHIISETATFPATMETVVAVRNRVEKYLKQLGWDAEAMADMDIAVSDAATNSVGRGSLGIGKLAEGQILAQAIREEQLKKPDATITVSILLSADEAVITMDDEGGGFDFEAQQRDGLREGQVVSNGRGVGMMAHYVNVDVQYENGGRRIILRKMKNKADGAATPE